MFGIFLKVIFWIFIFFILSGLGFIIFMIIHNIWEETQSFIKAILIIITILIMFILVLLIINFSEYIFTEIKTMLNPIYYTIKPIINQIYRWFIYLIFLIIAYSMFLKFVVLFKIKLKRKKKKKEKGCK